MSADAEPLGRCSVHAWEVGWPARTSIERRGACQQANARLPQNQHIHLSAHLLRHTMLRKAAEKYGVQYAMELAAHTSSRYIWRYVQPSDEEKEAALEDLF